MKLKKTTKLLKALAGIMLVGEVGWKCEEGVNRKKNLNKDETFFLCLFFENLFDF